MANYISTSANLGGYAVEQQDATEQKSIYQSESFFIQGKQSDFYYTASYRYSDFHETRPNSYLSNSRLGITGVKYAPSKSSYSIFAGRDFIPFINRNVLYDGGGLSASFKEWVHAEGYVGYNSPQFYQEGLFDFSADAFFFGGKLSSKPFPGTQIDLDLSSESNMDTLNYGASLRQNLFKRWDLIGEILYDDIIEEFTQYDVTSIVQLRQKDVFLVNWGYQDEQLDSMPSYEYFIHPKHQYVNTSYLFKLNEKLYTSLSGGLIWYDDFAGKMLDVKLGAYGILLGFQMETEKISDRMSYTAAYQYRLFKRGEISLASGLSTYSFENKKNLKASFYEIGGSLNISNYFTLTSEYQLLQNEFYTSDHRFYFGLKLKYFRGTRE